MTKDDKVQFIKVIIDYNISSLSELFKGCKYIETINFKRFYRSNINNMSYMFDGCISLNFIEIILLIWVGCFIIVPHWKK